MPSKWAIERARKITDDLIQVDLRKHGNMAVLGEKIALALDEEREQAAKIAENFPCDHQDCLAELSAAIRAGGGA